MATPAAGPAPDDPNSVVWQNNYHRPQTPWVCGRLGVGEPCWTGPTPSGTCGCRADCLPTAGDRGWVCRRPLHRGGPCPEGPTSDGACCQQRPPCVPVRSWRAQRDRLSLAALCLSVGLGLMIVGAGRTADVIAPGPLSSPHAQRLADQGNRGCASCHPQAHGSIDQWIGGWMGGEAAAPQVTQSDLCLKCHQRDFCQEHALVAHNVPPDSLATITRRIAGQAPEAGGPRIDQVSQRLLSRGPATAGARLACATCHREHHGQHSDLSAMTDQQCQSCHHQTFHRFELDHPEFRNWPRVTGPGIRFSHQSHFFKHFPHGNRPFECSQCHRDDDQGNVQQLVGYEQACGDCHQGPINLSSQAGLPWLQLPSLDVELLQAASQDVGQWPVGLSTDFEGRLSPFSQLLLMADPEASEGLTALGYQFDFLDLQPADPEHLVAARQIAWGLKRLLADLARRGTESIRHRLQIVLRRSIDDASLQRLTQNFSPTLFPDSAQHWFPHLGEEVLPDQGAPVFDSSTGRDNATASGAMDRSVSPRLVLPHDILARLIQDRADEPQPSELLSENPLAGRKTTSRMAGSPEPTASAQPTAPPTTVRPGDDGVRAPHRLPGPDGQAERQVLLAENPLANPGQSGDRDRPLVGVQPPATIPSPVRDSELSGSPAPRGSEPVRSLVAPQATADADRPRVKLVPADAFQPVGWVRNDRQYAIRYHLLGHADPWLKAWIDLLVPERASGGASELAGHVLNSLTAPDQAGNCLQCHGGEADVAGPTPVNWTARYRDPHVKGWTKFDHRPHSLLPSLGDCRSCHQLRELGGDRVARGPWSFVSGGDWVEPSPNRHSDFHPLSKSQCAVCHQEGRSSNGCTTCHNYHISP